PSRTAPRRTRPPTTRARTSISTVSRRRSATSASVATTPISAASACSTTRPRRRSRTRRSRRCGRGSRRPRPCRSRIRSSSSTTRTCSRRRTSARAGMAEKFLVEAVNDASPEGYYVHTPGVKVAIPSTPADAKGLLAAAIRDPDPVVMLEPKLIYRGEKQEVPEGEHVVPLGQARLAREGTDVTLVAYGAMVPVCERAADALEGEASAEVLDLRSLRPLDEDALLASASKTGRVVVVQEAPRTAGFGAEIAAILAEKAILDLQGPVLRVTGFDVPYP